MSAVIKYSPVTPSDFDRLIVYRDSALLALTQTAIVVLGDPYCARYQVPGTRYQVPGTRYQVPGRFLAMQSTAGTAILCPTCPLCVHSLNVLGTTMIAVHEQVGRREALEQA